MSKPIALALLRQPKRLWAIPAVHGMVHRLLPVADAIAARLEPGDALVFLGNLIGGSHGEETADVATTLDVALALRRQVLALPGARACDVAFLRGTQEEMWTKLEQLHFAQGPRTVLSWMLRHGLAGSVMAYGGTGAIAEGERAARDGPVAIARWLGSLRQALRLRPGHAEWLAAVRRAALSEDGHLLAVHHGIDTMKPLDSQGDAFWWGGSTPFEAIDSPYGDVGRVIRGFDRSHPGVVDRPHTLTLDSGCGFGGPLVAGLLDERGNVLDVIGD